MPKKAHVVVIGAGVIGLQTALHLLQSGYPVTIIAQHFPEDWSLSYTSPRAGAHWRSQSGDPFIQQADAETYTAWSDLLSRGEKNTGLALAPSICYWEEPTQETANDFRQLWWRYLVKDFKILSQSELPAGVVHGISYTTFAINPTQHMQYLLSKCRSLSVKTFKKEVETLEEIFSMPNFQDIPALVNCSGMGARNLVGDENVYPIKGQTVLVRGECYAIKFRKTKNGWQDAVIRRPGVGTILGVSKDTNDWSEDINPNLTEVILERCKELAPELLVNGEFEVIQAQIGRRPARNGGIRIGIESLEVNGRKRLVCHNYGHGGVGFQTAVGSANEAVRVLLGAMDEGSIQNTSKL